MTHEILSPGQREILLQPTDRDYPPGYFYLQLQFAQAATRFDLDTPDLASALFRRTAIHTRLFSKPVDGQPSPGWSDFVASLDLETSDLILLDTIWSRYCALPKSVYSPPEPIADGRHFGAFIWKYNPKKSNLELHFADQDRAAHHSNFSRSQVPARLVEINQLAAHVLQLSRQDPTFKPETVTLGSWMNNFPGVRASLPVGFVDTATRVVPPHLSFGGDSLWGQFLNRLGGINPARFDQFLDSIYQAGSVADLVNAFPIPVTLFRQDFSTFIAQFPLHLSV